VTCYVIDAETSYNLLLGRPWIHANWIVPSTLHQCFKYVEDGATVRTVFAEKQPFKGVDNYFTDALLYQEVSETSKESSPDNDDSGNEADSESEGDTSATWVGEPIIAYFNNSQCNTLFEDDDEWVINDNVSLDYPASFEQIESVMNGSLHMPLHKSSTSSTSVKCIEGSVLVVPPSKEGQSPIIFGKTQLQRSTATDSSSDSDTPQIFYYARSVQHMMRKMGYSLQRGNGLNFGKGRRGFLRNFMPTGKLANYNDNTRRRLGYVTPPPSAMIQSKDDKPTPSRSASSSEWESDVSVGTMFKNLTVNMTISSQLEHAEATDVEPWAQQLDFQ